MEGLRIQARAYRIEMTGGLWGFAPDSARHMGGAP